MQITQILHFCVTFFRGDICRRHKQSKLNRWTHLNSSSVKWSGVKGIRCVYRALCGNGFLFLFISDTRQAAGQQLTVCLRADIWTLTVIFCSTGDITAGSFISWCLKVAVFTICEYEGYLLGYLHFIFKSGQMAVFIGWLRCRSRYIFTLACQPI